VLEVAEPFAAGCAEGVGGLVVVLAAVGGHQHFLELGRDEGLGEEALRGTAPLRPRGPEQTLDLPPLGGSQLDVPLWSAGAFHEQRVARRVPDRHRNLLGLPVSGGGPWSRRRPVWCCGHSTATQSRWQGRTRPPPPEHRLAPSRGSGAVGSGRSCPPPGTRSLRPGRRSALSGPASSTRSGAR
jgi:hypothetical protein